MPKIINMALLGNWENWVRLFLMIAIGLAVLHFVNKLNAAKEA